MKIKPDKTAVALLGLDEPPANPPIDYKRKGFFDEATIQLIKATVAPKDLTDKEFALFMYQASRTGLDPLTRQIYCTKNRGKVSIQATIDGFRLIAERTNQYRGQTPVQWCGEDGVWLDVWLDKKFPSAARVGVLREGFPEPLYAVAKWETYSVRNANGEVNYAWTKMSDLMLGKVAEALALRKAFPQELSGLYSGEEMENFSGKTSDEMPAKSITTEDIIVPKARVEYNKLPREENPYHQAEDASDMTALEAVWKAHPALHKEKTFIELVTKCKHDLLAELEFKDDSYIDSIKDTSDELTLQLVYSNIVQSAVYAQYGAKYKACLEFVYSRQLRKIKNQPKSEPEITEAKFEVVAEPEKTKESNKKGDN